MLKQVLEGRFMKHPLHPLLVHLPVGLWAASLIGDVVFKISGNSASGLPAFSFWAIAGGLAGAVLAVPAGIADFLEIPTDTRPRRIAALHMILNVTVVVLFAIGLYSRYRLESTIPSDVTTGQFILSLVSVGILSLSGYLGGLLVYEHGIGFRPHERDQVEEPKIKEIA